MRRTIDRECKRKTFKRFSSDRAAMRLVLRCEIAIYCQELGCKKHNDSYKNRKMARFKKRIKKDKVLEKKNLTMVEVGWYINRASARNGVGAGEEKS